MQTTLVFHRNDKIVEASVNSLFNAGLISISNRTKKFNGGNEYSEIDTVYLTIAEFEAAYDFIQLMKKNYGR